MADLAGRYPIATTDGIAIPNDTIRPRGLYRIAISTSATAELTLAGSYKTIVLFSDVDCIIKFGGTASVPSSGTLLTDGLFLPKETIMTVSPFQMKVSAITLSGTGTLSVNLLDAWASLSLQQQHERG